jgi:6-phosphogluconate dehydrogenase
MELGMIGLGRMGGNMAERLMEGGHRLVVYDPVKQAQDAVIARGATGSSSILQLIQKLSKPRAIWVMVPSGAPTENTINELGNALSPGDTVIDGGNSHYKDSMRRAAALNSKGIIFLDTGTSGGIWGLKEGYCLMVGGNEDAYKRLEPIFQTLAPSHEHGYAYIGPSGSGHFVKMVHNGIEYGMMEAYAEGFELIQAKKEFEIDLPRVAEVWRYGSVVRSWLLDLAAEALHEDPKLGQIQAWVEDSGEGRWTVEEGIQLAVPVPVIAEALQIRFRSRQNQPFGNKLLAALRNKFGGHPVKKAT